MCNEPSGREFFLAAFANHIREWRNAMELSQATVAKRAGISVSTIRRIEAGKVDLKVTTFLALAKAMDAERYQLADVSGHELLITSNANFKSRSHRRSSIRGVGSSIKPPADLWVVYEII